MVRYFLTALWIAGVALSFGIELFTPARYHDYVALATRLVLLGFVALPVAIIANRYDGFSKWQK